MSVPASAPGRLTVIHVTAADAGLRLDRWLRRRHPGVSLARLQKWIRTGQVRVDGRRVRGGERLRQGQSVRIPPAADDGSVSAQPRRGPPPLSSADVTALRDRVLYIDDQVLVIDKPAGLAVQGGTGVVRHLDAMMEALRLGADEPPRLVHRLDKDTSGVLLLARTPGAARGLARRFRMKDVRKLYWAAVAGVPDPPEGRVELALAKVAGRRGDRVTFLAGEGKRAVTLYRVVARAGRRAAWLALEPLTGRTHQLRVHAVALGTPILGDGKYGGRAAFLSRVDIVRRLHLHARALRIPHPDGRLLTVSAPLPEHMLATWRTFGFDEESEARPRFVDTRPHPA